MVERDTIAITRGKGCQVSRIGAIGRIAAATAAGAGLGAGAALVRRHLLSDRERDDPTDVVADAAPPSPSDVAAHVHLQNIPPSAITEQDLATLQASVADLEAARARLRERAAALRAEMEDSGR